MKEILIRTISIDHNNVSVEPISCPKENSPEITQDNNGVYCIQNKSVCPYFNKVYYNMKQSQKTLFCSGE